MRCDEAVLRSEQRIIALDGLDTDHIHACGLYLAAVQRVRQILLHNKRTAAIVQNNDAVLHFCDGSLIDDAFRLRKQRAVQGMTSDSASSVSRFT